MLKTALLHPEILEALASAGHGAKVLIADSNYPYATTAGPNARLVFLNFAPGKLTVPEVLAGLEKVIPIEAAEAMAPDAGPEPSIYPEFREILGSDVPLQPVKRFDFYEKIRGDDTCLVIATGETRVYACIILTIGVVKP